MPYYPASDDVDIVSTSSMRSAEQTRDSHEFATEYRVGLTNRSTLGTVASFLPGTALDLADTVASALPGVERNDLSNKFLSAIGTPGLLGFYNSNQGAYEVGSGLVGTVIADGIAKRVLAPGSLAMQAIRKVPYAKRIATLDAQYERASRLALATQKEAATRGAMGIDRFIGGEMTLARLGAPGLKISRGDSTKQLFGAAIERGLVRNITTEAIMATTLHENNFLYSDDLAHNVAWGVAGLGIGGMVDSMITSYALRKTANSAEVRNLNRKAYDPTGFETQRLNAMSAADSVLRAANANPDDLGYMFKGSDARTDAITSMMIQSSELSKRRSLTERGKALFGRREALATPIRESAFIETNKVTVRGAMGVSGSGFSTEAEGLGRPILEGLERDATFLYGIREIATAPEGVTRSEVAAIRETNITKRLTQVQQLLADGGKMKRTTRKDKFGKQIFTDEFHPLMDEEADALRLELNELIYAKSATPVTMLEPGEWSPLAMGQIAENWTPVRPVREGGLGADNLAIWSVNRDPAAGARVGISSNGELYLPGNGNKLENLKPEEMLDLFAAGREMVKHFAATGEVFNVPANANWFVLDVAEQIAKAGDPSLVKYQGKMTRQMAAVESFAQKIDAVRAREKLVSQAATLISPAKGNQFIQREVEDGVYRTKVMLNLPRLTSHQQALMATSETPYDILIGGFKSGDEVRRMSYGELLQATNDARRIAGMTDETVDTLEDLHGTSFRFLADRDGNPIKPILGWKRPLSPVEYTRDELFMRQAVSQGMLRDALVGQNADELTRIMTETIMADPASAEARKVMELADDQQRSVIPGFRHAAPQTTMGSAINAVTSRQRRDIDSTVLRSASQVQELKTRIVQTLTKATFDTHMGDAITKLNSARNARSLMLVNQFLSFRQGWEIERAVKEVTLPNGELANTFVLDHSSVMNQRRFQEAYGRPLEKGQELLNPDGAPIALDALGFEVVSRMQKVHAQTLAAKNTLLRSQGMPEIKQTPWYAPAPNTKNKYVSYTFDMQNNVVPGMTLVADTPQELAAMTAEIQASKQWKDTYTIRDREYVKAYMTLWDKAQADFIAPNVTAIQPKKQNFGRTGGNKLNTQAFNEALVTMRDSLISHGDDIVDVLYDPVIKAAYARAKIARVQSTGQRSATQHSSVYDRYLQNLTGRSSLSAKDSFVGDFYAWAEERLNGFLASQPVRDAGNAARTVAARAGETWGMLNEYLRVTKPTQSLQGERFDKFAKELGEYMPFKSAQEMLERETKSRTPTEVAEITSKLSWFEAASRLRYLESAHAVVNIASIISNMPSVIRAMQPKAGESLKDAAARNGMLSMTLNLPDGRGGVVLPNAPKLLWASYQDALKGGMDEFTKKAIMRGYMDQEVAEFHRAWGAIDSKAGWRGFFFGDAGRKAEDLKGPFKNQRAKIAQTGGVDKWLGVLSDKSEGFTRQWGMYAGRRIAQSLGIKNVDAQLSFAHEITNKLIANYDPRNRPEVFQGALGAPAGLFQSYVFNFYERLFRYVETKDTASLATQYAMQAGMFGTSSVPGWDALNWAFFDQGQAKNQDPVESIYKRFGDDLGDLVMHGTLSNLPKMFGADGVALYTRGDAQFRMPVIPVPEWMGGDGMANMPAVDTLSRIWNGMGQALDLFKQDNEKVGMNQLAEIASNVLTNRPLAGLIETFGAGGYDTAWDGQVVAATRSASDVVYRSLGVRSMIQQKSIDQFYASKNAQEEQEARKSVLRGQVRAAIRDKRFDAVPKLFADYVEQGGDPRHYSRFLKESFKSALDTRAERMLDKALKDPNNASNAYIARLLDAGIDVAEDEESGDDYGREAQIEKMIQDGWATSPDLSIEEGMPRDTDVSQEEGFFGQ